MNGNFYEALDAVMAAQGSKAALVDPVGGTLSYEALRAHTAAVADVLAEAGVQTSDRVLVQADKSMACVVLYLAVLRRGAVYVPINTAYTDAEVAYFVADAQPRLFVHEASRQAGPELSAALADGQVSASPIGRLAADRPNPEACPEHALAQRAVRRAATRDTPPAVVDGHDMAAIVYTSGTTGRSKGAMLSHSNIASNARALLALWGWRSDDVLLHALPIFHVHGLFVALHCALLGGSTVRFLPQFDAETVCEELDRCTVLMGVPTFYTRLLALPQFDRAASAGMRLFISGSAPLTEQTFAQFEARTGQRILERYGMSETVMITSNPLAGERVAGTVGFPLPGVDVRVVDEQGEGAATGQVGSIEVRGPNVFAGYWQQPEKTRSEFREGGFFITGDLGIQDDDGRLSIVGRSKDLVISGGYNIYPKEVERLLDAQPAIRESAVIGVPHADFGEAVVAVVVPALDQEPDLRSVQDALGEQLARYKQPKHVAVVNELPRNAMGKVQKNLLRDRFEALFAG